MTEADKIWISFLEDEHKIKREVWQKYLRFDEEFMYIAYYDYKNPEKLKFEKKRKVPSFTGSGKYLYSSGSGMQLWPNRDISKSSIWVLTEGELDALTLESYDFPSITSGGVTSFKRNFTKVFLGRKVYICFDTDQAGVDGAEKVAKELLKANVEVYIIDLPKQEGLKDIGDFFKLGHTPGEFMMLIKNARKFEIQQEEKTNSWTETPQQELISRPLTYNEVEDKVLSYLPGSGVGLRIVLSIAISAAFPSEVLLWLLLVGVPSSGKTELVRLIRGSKQTYYLDNLTQNAFISGERETESQQVHDLLPLLNKKCLIVKDWTSIFSHDEKMTKKILGDLVNIYDKIFIKFSSRRGQIGYKSEFSQIGCITPSVLNRHTNYMNMVGPRFLCYIIPTITMEERDKNYEMIFSGVDRKSIGQEANLYVISYIQQLTQKSFVVKPLTKDVRVFLRTAAELMSSCRGIVVTQSSSFKNDEGIDVRYYDVVDIQIEDPWRAIQQLKSLISYLAFVVGKDEVGVGELAIIKEIVLSSMPADRSQAIRAIKEHQGIITAKDLSETSEKSTKTSRRLLDELNALKVVEKIKGSGEIANDYKIHPQFRNFILLEPAEFLSSYSSGTETTDGMNTEQENIFGKGGDAL